MFGKYSAKCTGECASVHGDFVDDVKTFIKYQRLA